MVRGRPRRPAGRPSTHSPIPHGGPEARGRDRDALRVLFEIACAELQEAPHARVDELVYDASPLAARLDETAEAQTGEVRGDARLISAKVADGDGATTH